MGAMEGGVGIAAGGREFVESSGLGEGCGRELIGEESGLGGELIGEGVESAREV